LSCFVMRWLEAAQRRRQVCRPPGEFNGRGFADDGFANNQSEGAIRDVTRVGRGCLFAGDQLPASPDRKILFHGQIRSTNPDRASMRDLFPATGRNIDVMQLPNA
jgi:hypothetical protein